MLRPATPQTRDDRHLADLGQLVRYPDPPANLGFPPLAPAVRRNPELTHDPAADLPPGIAVPPAALPAQTQPIFGQPLPLHIVAPGSVEGAGSANSFAAIFAEAIVPIAPVRQGEVPQGNLAAQEPDAGQMPAQPLAQAQAAAVQSQSPALAAEAGAVSAMPAPDSATTDRQWTAIPLISAELAETITLSLPQLAQAGEAPGLAAAGPDLAADGAEPAATDAGLAASPLAVPPVEALVAAAPPAPAEPLAIANLPVPAPEPVVAPAPAELARPTAQPAATGSAPSDVRPTPLPVTSTESDAAGLAQRGERSFDMSPGQRTFPMPQGGPGFTADDELILQIKVRGIDATDTVVAFGTRDAVYLPLGELAMILDLAIRVSDDGHYASGWFLAEDRTVTIDLRQGLITTGGRTVALAPGVAQAFAGELYIRTEALAAILPMDVEPNLRSQSVLLTTREPFPFEERMRRGADRARLAQQGAQGSDRTSWPRAETPWLPASFPVADIEARVVSDSQKGTRAETDLRMAGDLAWMTAEAYISVSSRDGLLSSLLEAGRRDVDGNLLGPLAATEYAFGDVATAPMPLGLRGTAGRGAYVTNHPFESYSVFERVDLRGVLPDGYEVELYRNGVLLGSTARANNGQYEFLQVPVDYGLNVFRIVFYGPQGQRREEVRRISVGDGRLSPGTLEYAFGAVQSGTNVLGVRGPDFRPGERYGDWQTVGELAYGFNSDVTGVASAAFFEKDGSERWIVAAGLRTGLAGFAVRADAGLSDGNGYGAGLGLGGQALGGAFSLSHFEYGGGFVDEVRSFSGETLRRSSELEFNATLGLASGVIGTALPISARARRSEYSDGRSQLGASLRGSARLPGFILSNTVEYSHTAAPGSPSFSQLAGDFNLATFNRSRTQLRASLGYQIVPQAQVTHIAADLNRAIDDHTTVSASAGYSLVNDEVSLGASAIREFDRFTLAFDGQYSPQRKTYAVALRLGLSLGRDPLRERLFVSSPGRASSGAVALRAFQDLDGDLLYGPGDRVLPDVDFAVFNNVATTDTQGLALLGELGNGNPVAVQVDPSSLPDIAMAPASRGIEVVPRPGRIQALDFPIVELSEIEGTVLFADGENRRGVSGLRLRLRNAANGQELWARTERGGYFFYEQVPPGEYEIVIDPDQASRLGICLVQPEAVKVPPSGTILQHDFAVHGCD